MWRLREALAGFVCGMRGLVAKELQSRSRGWRPMWLLTVYLLLIAGVIAVFLAQTERAGSMLPAVLPAVGARLFAAVTGMAVVLLAFITPALTVGSISGERERQTLDLLLVTRASPLGLIAGKLLAAVLYVFYLLAAALPAFAVVYLFGGVAPRYLLLALAIAAATALVCTCLGLLVSTLTRRTLLATVVTYLLVLALLLGAPLLWGVSGHSIGTQPTDATTPRVVLPPGVWAYLSPTVSLISLLQALFSTSGAFGGVTAVDALPLTEAVYQTRAGSFLIWSSANGLVISWAPWVYQLTASVVLAVVSTLLSGFLLAPVKPWQRWRRGRTRASQERLRD